MKRVLLFIATNIAIMIVLSITLRILGVDKLFVGSDLDFTALLIFAAVFGMGGSFISLAISKWSAKMMTGAKIITQPNDAVETWLIDTVSRQAKAAKIGMPEVAIYDSPDVNAFATGMNRDNALVAVSTGLLHQMEQDEVEAVLAHEISHVANGDMVTLALIQGVVNTFVIFFARTVGYFVDRVIFKHEGSPGFGYYITSIIAEMVFSVLASIIVMWFSRQREYRADAGSAKLVGANKMIAALQRLQAAHQNALPAQLRAFGITGKKEVSWKQLFMTHPPLADRIEALRQG